ncbi:MAG: hypothetical protein AAF380_01900, partial [Bacteroidota bacterium]
TKSLQVKSDSYSADQTILMPYKYSVKIKDKNKLNELLTLFKEAGFTQQEGTFQPNTESQAAGRSNAGQSPNLTDHTEDQIEDLRELSNPYSENSTMHTHEQFNPNVQSKITVELEKDQLNHMNDNQDDSPTHAHGTGFNLKDTVDALQLIYTTKEELEQAIEGYQEDQKKQIIASFQQQPNGQLIKGNQQAAAPSHSIHHNQSNSSNSHARRTPQPNMNDNQDDNPADAHGTGFNLEKVVDALDSLYFSKEKFDQAIEGYGEDQKEQIIASFEKYPNGTLTKKASITVDASNEKSQPVQTNSSQEDKAEVSQKSGHGSGPAIFGGIVAVVIVGGIAYVMYNKSKKPKAQT